MTGTRSLVEVSAAVVRAARAGRGDEVRSAVASRFTFDPSGLGAARFNAFLDNTEVFFAMMNALGLRVKVRRADASAEADPPARPDGDEELVPVG